MRGSAHLLSRSIVVVAVLLALVGIALAATSTLSFPWLKTQVDSLSQDGDARAFTAERFQMIASRSLPIGGFLLVVAAVLFVFRHQTVFHTTGLLDDSYKFMTEGRQRFADLIRSESTVHWITLGVITIAGFCFRVAFWFQPMRHDEAFTFEAYASKPLYLAFSKDYTPNNHLLHTLLVWICTRVFGSAAWSIRLPAFLAGLLLIPAVYAVVRTYYNSRAALIAAALVAASSGLIEYSTNARGYTLLALFFLLLLAVCRELVRSPNRLGWFMFAVLVTAGLCTSPTMAYAVTVCSGWLCLSVLLHRHDPAAIRTLFKRLTLAFMVAGAVTTVAYLPSIIVSGPAEVFQNRFIQSLPLEKLVHEMPRSLGATWRHWHEGWPWWLAALTWAGLLVAILFHRRISTERMPLLLVAVAICAATILAQRVMPFRRVWLFLLPLYLGTAAAGIQYCLSMLPGAYARSAVFVVALGLCLGGGASVMFSRSVSFSDQTGTAPDAETVALFLKNQLRPGDRVIGTLTSSAPLAYYFRLHAIPRGYLRLDPNQAARIIAVVDEAGRNPDVPEQDYPLFTMDGALREENVALDRLDKPSLMMRFGSASVYSLNVLQGSKAFPVSSQQTDKR